MTRVHGRRTRVWVDGYNLSGDSTNLDVSSDEDPAEVTTFGDERKHYIPGQNDVSVSHDGLFDDGESVSFTKIVRDRIGSPAVVFAGNYGTVLGVFGWAGTASPLKAKSVASPLAGAVSCSAEYAGPMYPVTMACDEDAVIGTAAVIDTGVQSNVGLVACLQVTGMDVNGTVRLEHATTSGGAYSTLVDFGVISSRTAVLKSSAIGTVRQFLRLALPNSGKFTKGFVSYRRLVK